MLRKVRALLAKAESTQYDAEAEAYTATAQSLMARHSIDSALLAASDTTTKDEPGGRRIGIDRPYEDPKVSLLNQIALANRCRIAWSKYFGYSTVIGHEGDLDATEMLFTSLLVQATHSMADAGSRQDYAGRSRTRSFRKSFLQSFAQRIGERLQETADAETRAATERSTGSDLVPVLAARTEAVDAAVDALFPKLVERRMSGYLDAEGWEVGRKAADLARIGGDATQLPGA